MKSKIKIVFILPSLRAGGTEKVISLIVNRLSRKIFQPYLIVAGFKKDSFFEINSSEHLIFLNKSRFYYSIRKLHSKIQNLNPNIIFSSSHHINTFLLFYNLLFKSKVVLRINSIPSFFERRIFFWLKIKSLLFKKVSMIIFQSNAIKRDFISVYGFDPSNSVIINNPNLIPKNVKLKPCKKPHFITISSLTELKGHKRVIECLTKLDVDFLYTIIGDGILFNELRNFVKEIKLENKIFFVGEKKIPQRYLHNNSIYLMGSFYEGFPNSILEVLSLGIPVIAFNSPGGHNEIIREDFNGFLCKDKNHYTEMIRYSLEKKWNKDY